MSNRAAAARSSASVRVGFSAPTPFFKNTYYYHGLLGAVPIRLGLYEQALNEINQAMNIAGPNARYLSNMALADYKLGRYADSIDAARMALRLDSNYNPAHYVLGVTLARDRRTMPESVPHLELAARTIPSAKAVLAMVQKVLSRN
jgi:tetratricopeptide (TPR) repeat protein